MKTASKQRREVLKSSRIWTVGEYRMDGHLEFSPQVTKSFASLPPELYDLLFQDVQEPEPNQNRRQAVAFGSQRRKGVVVPKQRFAICWALRGASNEQNVGVPSDALFWLSASLERPTACSIYPTRILQLSSIILQAQSVSAYEYASGTPVEELQKSLSQEQQQIIRQGLVYHLSPHLAFKALLCEPVLQGYVDPQATEITILAPPKKPPLPVQPHPLQMLELDEDFLDHSLQDEANFSLVSSKSHTAASGSLAHHNAGWTSFATAPLREPLAEPSAGDRTTLCFASTPSLVSLGALSGDWLLVKSDFSQSEPRLVRICALPQHFEQFTEHTDTIYFHPVFLHNVSRCSSTTQVLVRSFQSSHFNLHSLPVAQAITLSRIGTFISTTKQYQPLFDDALRRHLVHTPRILKNGDWIAVTIDSVLSRWSKTDSTM